MNNWERLQQPNPQDLRRHRRRRHLRRRHRHRRHRRRRHRHRRHRHHPIVQTDSNC